MRRFRAVAEKSLGIRYGIAGRRLNAAQIFAIRDVFDPNLRATVERRTWDDIPAENEAEARRLFDEAIAQSADLAGFRLVSLTEVRP